MMANTAQSGAEGVDDGTETESGSGAEAETVDRADLERKVKETYRSVALSPTAAYHFEIGRGLAERLGYDPADLDRIPAAAIDSFAGVGYHFDLAAIERGDEVLDLGSGSGMDAFVAALHVGESGRVTGVDMTDEQLEKSRRLGEEAGRSTVTFERSYIEALPFAAESFDVVTSNGVINLSADKRQVFREASRVLRPGGRLAISDIVTREQMPARITCNSDLWASCIGGAMQVDDYRRTIEDAGFGTVAIRENPEYAFLSDSARGASETYGVTSVSLTAVKR